MVKKDVSIAILRIGLALVFLYFGFSQVISPDSWASFVPEFLSGKIITANNLVMINGILEITLGIFLIIGLYTRFSALILSIHLLFIAISIGFSPLGVRDFGLAIATFAIYLYGEDEGTIDWKSKNRSS